MAKSNIQHAHDAMRAATGELLRANVRLQSGGLACRRIASVNSLCVDALARNLEDTRKLGAEDK